MPARTRQSRGGGGAGAPQLSALLWNCALFNPNGGCRLPAREGGLSLLPVVFWLGLVGWGRWFVFSLSCWDFFVLFFFLFFLLLGPPKMYLERGLAKS